MVKAGACFLFSTNQSGIQRWTDALRWTPSRIQGNFLVYKQARQRFPPGTSLGEVKARYEEEGGRKRRILDVNKGVYVFGDAGLIKRTMSALVQGERWHLVTYHEDHEEEVGRTGSSEDKLIRPSQDPGLEGIIVGKDIWQGRVWPKSWEIPPFQARYFFGAPPEGVRIEGRHDVVRGRVREMGGEIGEVTDSSVTFHRRELLDRRRRKRQLETKRSQSPPMVGLLPQETGSESDGSEVSQERISEASSITSEEEGGGEGGGRGGLTSPLIDWAYAPTEIESLGLWMNSWGGGHGGTPTTGALDLPSGTAGMISPMDPALYP